MNIEDLKIEVARIHKLDGTGATKAFCDVSIADSFMIKGLRIVEGEKGLFVVMPREEGKDGKWYNTVVPLKREVKDEIERIVLEAYGD
ncbi:MAG: septation protein SpoVG family protein [Candidatus Omnitrophica bacterium]|nr:septation protein SpoVG family protein [Candidatus Omnitrophota bacterium]